PRCGGSFGESLRATLVFRAERQPRGVRRSCASAPGGQRVRECSVTEGNVEVSRVDGVLMLIMDEMQQSAVDLSDPTRLVFDYMRRMGDLVDAMPAGPLRALHIGGAAMSLARYLSATRKGSTQIVMEPSEEMLELVRREAPLPARSGIKVRAVDG